MPEQKQAQNIDLIAFFSSSLCFESARKLSRGDKSAQKQHVSRIQFFLRQYKNYN